MSLNAMKAVSTFFQEKIIGSFKICFFVKIGAAFSRCILSFLPATAHLFK